MTWGGSEAYINNWVLMMTHDVAPDAVWIGRDGHLGSDVTLVKVSQEHPFGSGLGLVIQTSFNLSFSVNTAGIVKLNLRPSSKTRINVCIIFILAPLKSPL